MGGAGLSGSADIRTLSRTVFCKTRGSARSQGFRGLRFAVLLALGMIATPKGLIRSLEAHEIPSDVTIRAFLHPTEERLQFLVRAPLEAMRDLSWPTRGPGYLDLERVEPLLRDAVALWLVDNIELYADENLLLDPTLVAARVSLPNDASFRSFEEALTAITSVRLPATTEIFWDQALLDVLLEYRIPSESAQFSLRPAFARLGIRVHTVLNFLPAQGSERIFSLAGDAGIVILDPRWHQAAWHFIKLGFVHILDGIDHLLFLLCLVIPLRRFRPLVLVITSFTLAHSITLAAAALGMAPAGLWFPPLIETLIAISIVYMAIENLLGVGIERRWIIAFGFGLVHGFGFSFALQETLQFAGRHLISALLSFNLGVELGQLLVIGILIPTLLFAFRHMVAERIGAIILSVLVGHTAWHWMLERGSLLSLYSWPAFTPAGMALLLRWLMLGVAVAGLAWAISLLRNARPQRNLTEPEGTNQISSDQVG